MTAPEDRWELLHDAISNALSEKSIGHPRALRVTAHVSIDRYALESFGQKIAGAANEWFGGEGRAVNSLRHDGASADLLIWPTGSTAVISVSAAENGHFGGSLMLMGTHGSLYHDFDEASL